jgi:mannose-6-phosphate isomerase-like protein (cupin superfamily)
MKHLFAILFAASTVSLPAADPAGLFVWPKGVPPDKGGAKFSNHSLAVSHRDKDGIPEVHEKMTDIFVIQSGEAQLLLGGQVVGGKTTEPGEMRGGTIKNGMRKNVSAGDVVHIPANTPHQFFVAKGKQVTYFVVKVANP